MRTVKLVVLAAAAASAAAAARPPAIVSSRAIAGVRFATPQAQAVAELGRVLGRASRRLPNSGCGARYREVAWGHLYVEFRAGKLSGFRYMTGSWLTQAGAKATKPQDVLPRLRTAQGISLGSTLGQLRAAYGRLDLAGTDRWQAGGGLVFYDDAQREPPPASSRIVEIKFGTCGDF